MIHNNWWPWLQIEWKEPYFVNLSHFIHEAYETKDIYPPKAQVFSAFESCDIVSVSMYGGFETIKSNLPSIFSNIFDKRA